MHKSVNEKRNLTWIDEIDKFLVDQSLIEQMHKGQNIWGVFIMPTYVIVVWEIGQNFDLSCESKHIKKIEWQL